MIDPAIIRAAARGIRPPRKMSTAEWAEENYYLPPESAAEPGLISFKRTPYSYGLLDAYDDPKVEFMSLMMAAQLAKTTVLLAILGRVAATPGEGAPVLTLMPTISNAEMLSKERFQPMVEASPTLKRAQMAGNNNSASGGQKVLQKRFVNGTIVNFVGTNAPGELASRPVKVILADECDRFAVSAGKEGDPLSLAIKRTNTFRGNGRKVIVTSTPTLAGVSVIERQYKLSDRRKYYVPCPHCGHEQTLEFDNIQWEGEDPTTAQYPCPECGTCWSEQDRLSAVSKGRWVATRTDVTGHAGFEMNALYSPWVGQWDNAVKEWLNSKGDPALEPVFVNTYLGQPYTTADLAVDEEMIMNRMTAIGLDMVPAEVLCITVGVDVQADRLEVLFLGHSETQRYILDHRKIFGDPTDPGLWEQLDELLQTEFNHELGGRIKVDATAIDTGFQTQKVYEFVLKHPNRGYHAIKGVAGHRLIWDMSKRKLKKGEARLFLVGVEDAKVDLMESLKQGDREQPGFIYITDMGAEAPEFAKQLIAEHRVVEFTANRPVIKWERKSTKHRAEVMDCFVYASAVRHGLSPNWDMRRQKLTRVVKERAPANPTQGKAPPPKKRGWAKYD